MRCSRPIAGEQKRHISGRRVVERDFLSSSPEQSAQGDALTSALVATFRELGNRVSDTPMITLMQLRQHRAEEVSRPHVVDEAAQRIDFDFA